MTPKSIDRLYWEASQIASDTDRAAFLDRECAADAALRERVEQLLSVRAEAESFLETPPAELGTIVEGLPAPPEVPGAAIGPYRLVQLIGEGGMGDVWLAEQSQPLQRQVALKVIKPGMDSRQVVARFEAERQALALMDHPNIAKVIDAGATGSGRPYFVMELVQGVPITRYCDEHGLGVRERLGLFVAVCRGVQHAHQKGLIHRDLKPSNVLVASCDGRPAPKVIDFGVTKATGPKLTERTLDTTLGALVGTLEYMSPEQADLNPLDIDTRSDVYSLGVMLYELLTGTTPLERKRMKESPLLEVLRAIRETEPPRPSVRLSTSGELHDIAAKRGMKPKTLCGVVCGELDWIAMKCLEKDPRRRYETPYSLALDLERYLVNEPLQEAGPPSALYRFGKFARRNRLALAAASTITLTLLLATLVSLWQVVRATRAEAMAVRDRDTAQTAEAHAAAEAERARQQTAEAQAQRQLAELYARIALLISDPERQGLSSIRVLLTQENRNPEALLRIARNIVARAPGDEEAWKLLAVAYEAAGRHAEALAHFDRAVREAPDSAPVHNRLAWFLVMCPDPTLRDPGRAVGHARRAVDLARTVPWYWNTLGVAHYRTGDWRAALAALEKSSSLGWDDGYNSFFLAMVHFRLGDRAAARRHYEQGLQRQQPALPFVATELGRIHEEVEEVLKTR